MPMPEILQLSLMAERLASRYGRREARSIARIVWEDAFDNGRCYDEARFAGILARLEAGEPVQYVLGEADFWGMKFKVSPAVLIPRQETEELVAWVLEHLKNAASRSVQRWLDIGLGSGCIAIAVKKKYPAVQMFGLEKSPEALAVAQENARSLLGESLPCFLADVLDRHTWTYIPALDGIVSNPPYIPEEQRALVPEHVARHEPSLALFVQGDEPLLFYRAIADLAMEKLHSDGALFFECNEFNAHQVAQMLVEKGFYAVESRRDLLGAERMVAARKP